MKPEDLYGDDLEEIFKKPKLTRKLGYEAFLKQKPVILPVALDTGPDTEIKIGDTVECCEDGDWKARMGTYHKYLYKVGTLKSITPYTPCGNEEPIQTASISGVGLLWPLRAVKKVNYALPNFEIGDTVEYLADPEWTANSNDIRKQIGKQGPIKKFEEHCFLKIQCVVLDNCQFLWPIKSIRLIKKREA